MAFHLSRLFFRVLQRRSFIPTAISISIAISSPIEFILIDKSIPAISQTIITLIIMRCVMVKLFDYFPDWGRFVESG